MNADIVGAFEHLLTNAYCFLKNLLSIYDFEHRLSLSMGRCVARSGQRHACAGTELEV